LILRRLRQASFAVTLFVAASSQAHDPFEITTDARIEHGVLTLASTMPAKTASELRLSPRTTLFEVQNGGRLATASEVKIQPGDKGELVLSSNHPNLTRGPLHLRASHLLTLPEGYTSSIKVLDRDSNRVIAIKVMHKADPTLSVTVPAGVPSGGKHAALAQPAADVSRRGASAQLLSMLLTTLGMLGLLYWMARRPASQP
jgi:hypothetical protein